MLSSWALSGRCQDFLQSDLSYPLKRSWFLFREFPTKCFLEAISARADWEEGFFCLLQLLKSALVYFDDLSNHVSKRTDIAEQKCIILFPECWSTISWYSPAEFGLFFFFSKMICHSWYKFDKCFNWPAADCVFSSGNIQRGMALKALLMLPRVPLKCEAAISFTAACAAKIHPCTMGPFCLQGLPELLSVACPLARSLLFS